MAKFKSAFSGLRCLDCGEITHSHVLTQGCPHCSGDWLHAEYQLENLEAEDSEEELDSEETAQKAIDALNDYELKRNSANAEV